MIERRGLITGLAAVLAMPAVVRAESLMKVSGERYFFWEYTCPLLPDPSHWKPEVLAAERENMLAQYLGPNKRLYEGRWTMFGKTRNVYTDEVVSFSKREYPPASTAMCRGEHS